MVPAIDRIASDLKDQLKKSNKNSAVPAGRLIDNRRPKVAKATGMRTKATVVAGIKPGCYQKQDQNRFEARRHGN